MPTAKRKWIVVAAIGALTLSQTGASLAQQASPPPTNPAPSGTEHGGMSHEMGHGGMGQGGMGHEGMSHGGMSHEATAGEGHKISHGQSAGEGAMVPMMMCRTAKHLDGRLAYLRTELKPTDAQTPQWNAFAEAIRGSGEQSRGLLRHLEGRARSTSGAREGRAAWAARGSSRIWSAI